METLLPFRRAYDLCPLCSLGIADAIHLGLVQGIDFIVVFGLLSEHAFVEQKVFLVALE